MLILAFGAVMKWWKKFVVDGWRLVIFHLVCLGCDTAVSMQYGRPDRVVCP